MKYTMFQMLTGVLIGVTSVLSQIVSDNKVPGSDRDSHGCVLSAGFEWCDSTQQCQRLWELPCSHTLDMNSHLIPYGCVTWFDGCNTCQVVNGAIQSCTLMLCMEQSEPHCYVSDGH